MKDDVQYLYCPRWIEESGLPARLNQECGEAAWGLYKRLLEAETEQNIFPEWFTLDRTALAEWCGLTVERMSEILSLLVRNGFLELRPGKTAGGLEYAHFPDPLPVEREAEEIRERIKQRGYSGAAGISLRYLEPLPLRSKFKLVRLMYEEVYGLRINPRIMEDLRELTERFELPLLVQAFRDAKLEKANSLSWVIMRLYRGVQETAKAREEA